MTEGGKILTDSEIKKLSFAQQLQVEVEKHKLDSNQLYKVQIQLENLEKDYENTVPELRSENVALEQQIAALKKSHARLTSKYEPEELILKQRQTRKKCLVVLAMFVIGCSVLAVTIW